MTWTKVVSGQAGAFCAPSPLLEQLSAAPSETSAQPHLASPQPGAAAARPRYLASAEGGGKKEEGAAQAAPSGRSCTKEAMRPCKLHVAGSKPAASTSQRGVMVTCLVANEALRVRFTASAPPAFVAQLAEHRTLNSEVAGSYPVDSLQSAMPQRSGAPLRMECNSQAGSTPVVDTSSHGVTVTQEVLIL